MKKVKKQYIKLLFKNKRMRKGNRQKYNKIKRLEKINTTLA